MIKRTTTRFAGYDCLKLENDSLALWVTQSAGPRIIGLSLQGGPNLLAQLPDLQVDCPGEGPFSFRGGHRLWHAPEAIERTYLPDDDPVTIAEIKNGILVTQPVEVPTGIQKSLAITLPGDEARVIVDHTLLNLGKWAVELAPWAITQFKPGGVAILPQPTALADPTGLLSNRHIVLWPYTPIRSPYLILGDRFIFIQAEVQEGAIKIGFPNPLGWLGYVLDGTLFVKQAKYQPDADYLDRGSSSECYCNSQFIELETLGPRTTLAPNESTTHCEEWMLYPDIEFQPNEAAAQELADRLGLATG